MRWKRPDSGETVIKKKFLLFPMTINYETRWLEFATIKYKCRYLYRYTHDLRYFKTYIGYNWEAIEFINE